jgi:hypothetical protein
MLYTNILTVAAPLLTLATSAHAISLGNIAGGIIGNRVHPRPNPGHNAPAPGPDLTVDPECEVYTLPLYPYRMIPLNKKWNNVFGTGDSEGYTAAFGGSTLNLQVGGSNAVAEKNIFLLQLVDPVSKTTKQLGFVVGKNQHCIAHGIPAVEETRNGNYWKVNMFAVSDGK